MKYPLASFFGNRRPVTFHRSLNCVTSYKWLNETQWPLTHGFSVFSFILFIKKLFQFITMDKVIGQLKWLIFCKYRSSSFIYSKLLSILFIESLSFFFVFSFNLIEVIFLCTMSDNYFWLIYIKNWWTVRSLLL